MNLWIINIYNSFKIYPQVRIKNNLDIFLECVITSHVSTLFAPLYLSFPIVLQFWVKSVFRL